MGEEPRERYRFVRVIGRGGMGEVHLVEDTRSGVRRALKVVHPRLASDPLLTARLRREARAIARLDHPGIVRLVDAGQLGEDGRPFLVMELVEGESLASLLQREGPLSIARVRSLLAQLVDAVAHAHARGVVHRDLKPENLILVSNAGGERLKVLDFGVAKIIVPDAGQSVASTPLGSVVGTVEYMAPEQLRGEALDGRVDVYAIGCIAYALLVGEPPFVGRRIEVIHAKMSAHPASPRDRRADVPAGLARVVLTCLRTDASLRYATVEELRVALRDEALGVEHADAAPPSTADVPTLELALPDGHGAEAHAATELLGTDEIELATTVGVLESLPAPAQAWHARIAALEEALHRATTSAERAATEQALAVALSDAARAIEAVAPELASSLRRLARRR